MGGAHLGAGGGNLAEQRTDAEVTELASRPAGGTRGLLEGRDRFVDLLRAGSIVLVVLGHLTIAAIVRRDGSLTGANALASSRWLQLATWLFQVIPLFFLVGGFANATVLARPTSPSGYLARRLDRLLRPTVLFAACWLVTAWCLDASGVAPATLDEAGRVAAQPLWFLSVYLVTVGLAPLQLALHRRARPLLVIVLPLVALLGDGLRLGHLAPGVAAINYGIVFLFAQELGFHYRDGTLLAIGPRPALAGAAAATGGLVLLTTLGPYPLSMVGVPGEALSNMSPPTFCIVLLTLAQTALALALRPVLVRLLARPVPWRITIDLNTVVLTLFLWHLTAFVLAGSALVTAGLPLLVPGTLSWWAGKPIWIASTALVLALLVLVTSGAERPRRRAAPSPRRLRWTTTPLLLPPALAVAAFGLAALAQGGFAEPFSPVRGLFGVALAPSAGFAMVLAGWLVGRGANRSGALPEAAPDGLGS